MRDLENEIRERAYHLWSADGQPQGNADAYWIKAERELASNAAARPLVKPNKTPGAARRARRKAA
jgi:Protein of unknown function (DUF2934)